MSLLNLFKLKKWKSVILNAIKKENKITEQKPALPSEIEALIALLKSAKGFILDNSVMTWTGFSSPEKLRSFLDNFITKLEKGELNVIKQIQFEFLPTASLCEHAMSNGWGDEYIDLASSFEKLCDLIGQENTKDETSIAWKSYMTMFSSGTFNPGLTEEQRHNIPKDFPKDLIFVLKLSNGQNHLIKGVFEARSGYSKVSKLKLLSLEQMLSLKSVLQNTNDLDVFNENMLPFAVDKLNSPDDVFCLDTQTNKVWLLWVGIGDPFLPADWQYAKFEFNPSFKEFLKSQTQLFIGVMSPKMEEKTKTAESAEKSIVLFEENTGRIKTKIEVYFNPKGELVIDGYDIGEGVKELLGDSDYEYQMIVPSIQISKVCQALKINAAINNEVLLRELARKYDSGTCFSEIRNLFNETNIEYQYFSWT